MQQVLQLRILLLHGRQPAPQLLGQLGEQRLPLQSLRQSVAPSLLPCMGRLTGQGRDWLVGVTLVLADLDMAWLLVCSPAAAQYGCQHQHEGRSPVCSGAAS